MRPYYWRDLANGHANPNGQDDVQPGDGEHDQEPDPAQHAVVTWQSRFHRSNLRDYARRGEKLNGEKTARSSRAVGFSQPA
jgi:hypothetical protein